MANQSAPSGFMVVGSQGVGSYTGGWKKVAFAAGDASATFIGTMVKYTGASVTVQGEVIPVVTKAAPADTKLAGAIQSYDPQRSGSWATYHHLASTQVIGYLPADPFASYQVEEDSVGGNINTATMMGNNIDFIAESGSTITGCSTQQIDSSTAANTAALPIRLVTIVPRADNDSTSANATWIVTVNQSSYTQGAGAN